MLLESILLAILFGKIRGGKFSRLSHLEFKRAWIFLLALIIQAAIILFGVNGNDFVLNYSKELYILSYVLLFIGIIINLKYRSLLIILLGTGLNIFAMINNGWKMPISIEGLLLAGYSDLAEIVSTGKLAFYIPLNESSRYGFLGKIITIPPPYFYPQLLSIGDIFITLGLFLFVQSIMTNESYSRAKMIRFKYKSRI